MSVRTMSLVFEYDMPELKTDDGKTVPDSTAKFVLLALADHCNDEGEGAYPGVKRICKKTSMSSQTVCNALNALRANSYTTLEGKSKADTNNYTINLEKLFQPLGFQRLESDDSNDKNPTIPAARVKPSINHQVNHPMGGLSEKEIQQANAQVDAMIANAKKVKYQNRDKIPEPYLMFADLYNELTKQEPTKRVIFDWLGTFEDWKSEQLQPAHIRAAFAHASRDGGFPVSRPGSLTNTAVGMKTKMLSNSSPQVDEAAVEATKQMLEKKNAGEFVPPPPGLRPHLQISNLAQRKGLRR